MLAEEQPGYCSAAVQGLARRILQQQGDQIGEEVALAVLVIALRRDTCREPWWKVPGLQKADVLVVRRSASTVRPSSSI